MYAPIAVIPVFSKKLCSNCVVGQFPTKKPRHFCRGVVNLIVSLGGMTNHEVSGRESRRLKYNTSCSPCLSRKNGFPEFLLETLHGERKRCIGGNMSPNSLIVAFTDKLVYAMPIQKPHRSEAERRSGARPRDSTWNHFNCIMC